MDEAIEDRVSDRRVAEICVPLIARQLARDDGRAGGVAVFHHLQEILPLDVGEGGEPPVIEEQDVERARRASSVGYEPSARASARAVLDCT